MSEPRPKVSVVMITYNHEKYIEQAVNSVLMQETDFDYEIIIGEDCSTDRTREILIELQKQHPDKIRLVLNPQNLGMIPNFVNVLGMARGEYIALLEGDDYWIHPQKLRIQVDYMEIHTECRICTHNVRIVDASDRVLGIRGYQNVKGLEEYLKAQNFIVTSSMLLRRPDRELPDWFLSLKSAGDWPLHIWLLMQGGGICCLEGAPMSSWRVHSGGVASFMTYRIDSMSTEERSKRALERTQRIIADEKIVYQVLPEPLRQYILERIFRNYVSLARRSYSCDRDLFYEAYAELCRLSPNGNFIPSSPRLLTIASRLVGYPRAEWLSSIYRQLIPLAWRKRVYRKLSKSRD